MTLITCDSFVIRTATNRGTFPAFGLPMPILGSETRRELDALKVLQTTEKRSLKFDERLLN